MKRAILLALALVVSACGGDTPAPTPTAPSPPSTPSPTRTIALSGTMDFGSIQVDNTFQAVLLIANNGNSTLTVSGMTGPSGYTASWTSGTISAGGSQESTVRFAPTEERTYNGTLTVNADHTSGANTIGLSGTGARPPGARTQFGAGTYLVGSEVAAGRYFSDPTSACYWERLSGLGGSFGEVLANEFVGFDAGQWIVDILGSDRAFKTDSDCGTWFQSQRRGLQADITPGMWLVGSQITPGTYRANAASSCYWERLRHFQGNLNGIIANDFANSAGQQLVQIRASDAGFHADDDCGAWTRISSLESAVFDVERMQSPSDIENNWQLRRRKNGRP